MNLLCVVFTSGMGIGVTVSLLGDRATFRPGATRAGVDASCATPPIPSKALWRRLGDDNRPDLHPDDSATTELVARWRTVLFGPDGALNGKLATSAA